MVTLQVWAEGADPASGIPLKRIAVTVSGGSAEAKWSYRSAADGVPPDADPSFTFSAHSAWCAYKASGACTVELKRPQITKSEWRDKDGESTSKGVVGEELTLSAAFNSDTEEEAGVTFKIYKDGESPLSATPVAQLGAVVEGGKAEAVWTGTDSREADKTGVLKYFFTVQTPRAKEAQSGAIEMKNPQVVSLEWEKQAVYYGEEVKLKITTFEVKEFAPQCKLRLWQKGAKEEDGYLLEEGVTMDAEEKKVTVKIGSEQEQEIDLELTTKIVCDSLDLAMCKIPLLTVLTGDTLL